MNEWLILGTLEVDMMNEHTPATQVRCPQGCSEQDMSQWQLEQIQAHYVCNSVMHFEGDKRKLLQAKSLRSQGLEQ